MWWNHVLGFLHAICQWLLINFDYIHAILHAILPWNQMVETQKSQITCQFHLQHTTQDPKVHACHTRWRSNIYQHPNLDPVQTIKDISSLRTHWWCTFENVSRNKSVYTIYLKWEVVNGEWEWKVELFVYSCLFGHHIQFCVSTNHF